MAYSAHPEADTYAQSAEQLFRSTGWVSETIMGAQAMSSQAGI